MASVRINLGVNENGEEQGLTIDENIKKAMDTAKFRVNKKNWDYVGLICGLPGSGKSTLARTLAKYCCEWFDEDYIAFDYKEFIKITNECPEYSSVVLDESFASLNSKTTMTPEFIRIINHIQIIRQKHLFIFLCLPNFFDLAKGVAIFRSSHLFVTYASAEGQRGRFLAFGRDEKRKLYVKGNRFMDYNCVKSNFSGRFYRNSGIINEEVYEQRKLQHLLKQDEESRIKTKVFDRNKMIVKLYYEKNLTSREIAELFGISDRNVQTIVIKDKTKYIRPIDAPK